jgi:DNA replication protein DnaC
MEAHKRQEDLLKIDNVLIPIIGIHKYNELKSLKTDKLSEDQKAQIAAYESKQKEATPEQLKIRANYVDEVLQPKEKTKFSITAKKLYNLFKANFQKVSGRPFVKVEGVTIKNLEPLIYYFSKDERFFQCENLSKISEPSFDKGLLIIGPYGNGKTTVMKVFELILKGIPEVGFKSFSANEVVTKFEKCSSEIDRDEFEKIMWRGIRNFDDLKTERIASNFGKVNIFKEILEERYRLKSKTFLICNHKEGYEDDLQSAIDELGEKYGGRVWDRVYEMFNVIEFKGKSFRK